MDGFIDGLSGKSAPFFWLIAVILAFGLIQNGMLIVRWAMELFRLARRLHRGERLIDAKPTPGDPR